MTTLHTITAPKTRVQGLTLTRIPEVGEKIDFVDTMARGLQPGEDGAVSRSRRGTVDGIYPNGIGVAYSMKGVRLHAFLGWADVAMQQRRTQDLLAGLKGEEDPEA